MSIIDSLSAGYRFLTRRLDLLFLPILLDLILWLAPGLSVAPLFERAAHFYQEVSATPGLTGPPLPTAIVGSPSLPPNAPQAGQPYSFQQFVAAVRAQGVAVRPSTQELQVPYFRVMGAMFFADDDQVVVFVYPDPAAREADSAKIDSEITRNEEDQPVRKIGDRAYPWRGKPNFYWRGNLLVQFVSDKDDTAAKLQQALEGL